MGDEDTDMTDVLTIRKRMYLKQKDRVKTSIDLNKSVSTRLAEIKSKHKLPYNSVINEVMDKTIGLDRDTKNSLLVLLEQEVQILHEKYKGTDEKDLLWRTNLMNQAYKLEELIDLLNL